MSEVEVGGRSVGSAQLWIRHTRLFRCSAFLLPFLCTNMTFFQRVVKNICVWVNFTAVLNSASVKQLSNYDIFWRLYLHKTFLSCSSVFIVSIWVLCYVVQPSIYVDFCSFINVIYNLTATLSRQYSIINSNQWQLHMFQLIWNSHLKCESTVWTMMSKYLFLLFVSNSNKLKYFYLVTSLVDKGTGYV